VFEVREEGLGFIYPSPHKLLPLLYRVVGDSDLLFCGTQRERGEMMMMDDGDDKVQEGELRACHILQ